MKRLFLAMLSVAATLAMSATEGVLPGTFSVSAERKVVFSQGNLQYQPSTNTWRLAEHQYDLVGDVLVGNVYTERGNCSNTMIDAKYVGWIDLFGWGTGNKPLSVSENLKDYTAFHDWGEVALSNGGGKNAGWRTLDWEEWLYLFLNRPNAAQLRGQATVNYMHGYIFLPDDWVKPTRVQFTPEANDWTTNTYTGVLWDQMQKAGAVFLPASGYRSGKEVTLANMFGFYWSSSLFNDLESGDARDFYFTEKKVGPRDHEKRYLAMSVRLVMDVQKPQQQPQPQAQPQSQSRTTLQPARPQPVASASVSVQPVEQRPTFAGALPGLFSVSAGKKIQFAQGNVQYQPSTKTWRFAERQYERMGAANAKIGAAYTGWIDLFGWGTGNNPAMAKETYANYSAFVDWGVNAISNGGNEANVWRTLSADEWKYLYCTRPNAAQLFGFANIEGVNGMIVLPDDWHLPAGLTFTPASAKGLKYTGATNYENSATDGKDFAQNSYTLQQWAKMEQAGAVFLPAGGVRSGTAVDHTTDEGHYWSSTTPGGSFSAYVHSFYAGHLGTQGSDSRYFGFSVRLVREPKVTAPAQPQPVPPAQAPTCDVPAATVTVAGVLPGLFSVNAGTKVQFAQGNVQYQPSTGIWRFADNQYDVVGDEETGNVYTGSTKSNNNLIKLKVYTGWLDLFGWGTGNKPLEYKDNPNLYIPFVDWGKNAFVNGGNKADLWRTLSAEEWTYLFEKRQNATRLRGQAVVNGVNGYMLLPDAWTAPAGVNFKPTPNNLTANVYTGQQWAKMEQAGAVFLPAASYRTIVNMLPPKEEGCYWSSSWYDQAEDEGAYMWFYSEGAGAVAQRKIHNGHSVRLVLNMQQVAKPAPKVITQQPDMPPAPTPKQEKQPVAGSGKTNPVPAGGLPGIYSVSPSKKVYFAKGNAQYNEDGYMGSAKFADHQWDVVGDATQGDVYYNGTKSDNNKANRGYAGWIDLHEWGGNMGQNSAKYVYSDFFGYKEWGGWRYENGGNDEGLWRTLTGDEWVYLFDQRKNAAKLRGQATVNNHHGYVLLPDNWQLPQGLTFTPQPDNWTANTYSAGQWALMEKNGAVFLPAAGIRAGKEIQGIGETGAYWSSTMYRQTGKGDVDARGISFNANSAKSNVYNTWHHGFSVRLVQDIDFVKPKKKSVWDDVTPEQLAMLPELEPEQEWKLYEDIKTIGDINPKEGYRRVKVDPNSFGAYLRKFPLKDDWTLYYYNGDKVEDQFGGYAVLDIDLGTRDILQCADAVMFLRASYLYAQKRYKDIHFNALSGKRMNYTDYVQGDYSPAKFRKYMDYVFNYANTESLEKELPQRKIEDVQIGDIFVVSGNPGHAMMVVDIAVNANGERALLFAQGMMPAQSVHVVTNLEHGEDSPWYMIDKYLDYGTFFVFPNYGFSALTDLKYFP